MPIVIRLFRTYHGTNKDGEECLLQYLKISPICGEVRSCGNHASRTQSKLLLTHDQSP